MTLGQKRQTTAKTFKKALQDLELAARWDNLQAVDEEKFDKYVDFLVDNFNLLPEETEPMFEIVKDIRKIQRFANEHEKALQMFEVAEKLTK